MKTSPMIPAAPHALPLLGHLVPLLRNPWAFLASLPGHGDMVRIRVGPINMVVICDPQLTREVLRDGRTFDKGGLLYHRMAEVLGNGIITCSHAEHRQLRPLVQPAFHQRRLPGYAQTMTSCIDEAIGCWHDGQALNVVTEMLTISSRVLANTIFSDALPEPVLREALGDVTTIFDGFFQRMLMPPPLDRLPTPGNRSYQRARLHLRHTCQEVIDQRRAGGSDRGDLLSALLIARAPGSDGRGLTDEEITDMMVTFFLGGVEAVATLLAWALHLLAQHPSIEQRLHDEVDTVLAGRPATHADLPQLQQTQRIITETLRLYPAGWFLTRTVTSATRLGHYTLPAGTTVVYSPYLIHRRDDLYDHPESFEPDRWDPSRPQPSRDAFIPFGGGSRKCIGDTFGTIEATLILATITARWRLTPVTGQRVRPAMAAALRPQELTMRVTTRAATTGSDSVDSGRESREKSS